MIKKKVLQALLAATLTINVSACVSIPAEAPELSVELGKHLGRLEKANIALLNKFFDLKRQEVNRFIETDWLPMFAKEVFSEPNFQNAWNQIINGGDKADQLRFVIMLGPKLLKKMDKARSDMQEPLNELEAAMETKIRREYTQAKAINNSLTSFLTSAAEVVESQNRYLAMTGIDEEAIASTIQRADAIVSGALSNLEKADDYSSELTKYKQKLSELKDKLN
ncbi:MULTISPECIES: hypothetical protein [unclassified Pseudoalteromonas]|uniref:hypothetical protein n=1 Tax=unclassified Pseudoalteromonas TaxID=194690 RepID=UPI0025B5AB76|nr:MULTISPECIES: hypothetical protein [unclassified Pseudoalteromonas]MDN3378712.1 hypothetical protein [Pseudoalteromonas sp. APC 3893]MDN3387201.1 hypothetical protein [Pseudoalteromonas sp. APC 4017]